MFWWISGFKVYALGLSLWFKVQVLEGCGSWYWTVRICGFTSGPRTHGFAETLNPKPIRQGILFYCLSIMPLMATPKS